MATNVTSTSTQDKTMFSYADEVLFSERDMILETYKLTPDRKGQKQILDFINLFRAHTEKGNNAIQGIVEINDLAVLPRQPPITPQLGVAVYSYQVELTNRSHNQGSRPILFS